MRIQKHQTAVLPLAVLLALGVSPRFQPVGSQPAIAQAPATVAPAVTSAATTFPYPSSVPAGTTIGIDGSSSMQTINNALRERFQAKFPGTTVNIANQGSDKALQELIAGKIDLAALGRPLTEQEKAQGLVAVPVARNKIAVIAGPNNPYNGSLSIGDFAKIFRGEITNWSQSLGSKGVRGPDAPVKIVDRPDSSDTRQSFLNYPVFQTAPFRTGPTAVRVTEDSTEAVIAKLGNDGIGYAIADQVAGNNNVRIITMHGTLPDDPRYPFSQPLFYIYKGPANERVQAFLGYAANAENQQAIEEARRQAVVPAPAPAPTVETAQFQPLPAPGENKLGWGPLWWLLLPLLGLPFLLKWAKGLGGVDDAVAAAPAAVATGTQRSRIILTPRNCRDAYAYWELSNADKATVRQFGQNMKLRLYDVTGINLDVQQAHNMREFDPKDYDVDMHLPIATDDRDYLVELGYTNRDGQWTRIARSEHVHVPKCPPAATVPTGTATAVATGTAAAVAATTVARPAVTQPAPVVAQPSRIVLTPRNCRDAYAYWELNDADKGAVRQFGQNMKLRLYDVTGINLETQQAHSMKEFDPKDYDVDMHLPIATDDRDYLVELGYTNRDGQWVRIARSEHVRVPKCPSATSAPTGVATAIATGTATATGVAGAYSPTVTTTSTAPSVSTDAHGSRIVLTPRNSADAYAYWEISDEQKAAVRRQGGQKLKLRLYDVTGINLDTQSPHSVYEFDANELDHDRHLPIRTSDRDYLVEIGYVTEDGRWLKLARSEHVHVPAGQF